MATAYLYDYDRMADAENKHSYIELEKYIKTIEKDFSYVKKKEARMFSYNIKKNEHLSKLYEYPVYIVDFAFYGIEKLHQNDQTQLITEVILKLKTEIDEKKGYYTFRLPSHIVDVISIFNLHFNNIIMCGGNVLYYSKKFNENSVEVRNNIDVFFADQKYIDDNKKTLINMAEHVFRKYQGQYHISPIMASRANLIYKDWMSRALNREENAGILVAERESNILGFHTMEEQNNSIVCDLGGTSNEFRGLGAYEAIIYNYAKFANETGKKLIIGTQMDNFVVQGVWCKIGLVPYMSYYSIHLDNRGA